jgi:hypothetical protein
VTLKTKIGESNYFQNIILRKKLTLTYTYGKYIIPKQKHFKLTHIEILSLLKTKLFGDSFDNYYDYFKIFDVFQMVEKKKRDYIIR